MGATAAVERERLREVADLGVSLELPGHAGHVVDHGACGVAGIGGRERAVEHADPLDLLGRHQAPARREGRAVAEVVRQQDAVGIDHRARAVAGARGAAGQDRVVVVADVALAHQQAREVAQRVFGVGGVDLLGDLGALDAFDRRRDLRRQRGRLRAGDDDQAERLDGGAVALVGLCGDGERAGERKRQAQGPDQGKLLHGKRKQERISGRRTASSPARSGPTGAGGGRSALGRGAAGRAQEGRAAQRAGLEGGEAESADLRRGVRQVGRVRQRQRAG
jgi:hypothetical protein